MVFERFTDSARKVVARAREEAGTLDHNYVGCEHLLLGLLRSGDDVGAQVLERAGVTLEGARSEVVRIVGSRGAGTLEHSPFTPRAKRVFETALHEALSLGAPQIRDGHLLLGLVSEQDGVHIAVLRTFGADPKTIYEEVLRAERDPKHGVTVGRAMTERSLMQAGTWLEAARTAERVLQAVAEADTAAAARERVAAFLGVEEWLAEFVLREPLLHFSRERVAEMRERRRYLLERLERLYGKQAGAPFRDK